MVSVDVMQHFNEVLARTVIPGWENLFLFLLHCHRQNDSCIKMGRNETHLNVLLNVRDKCIRRCPKTTTFEEKRAEAESNLGPFAYQPNTLLLGQAGSLVTKNNLEQLKNRNRADYHRSQK